MDAPQAIARALGIVTAIPAPAPARGVNHNAELDRVMALPRRTWEKNAPATLRLVDEMTAWLRRPDPTCPNPDCKYYKSPLLPVQAIALFELYHYGFLVGPQAVGSGKTIEAFLAGTVMRAPGSMVAGVDRPVVLIPAKLRHKTDTEFAHLAQHYRAPRSGIRILHYEEISRDYGDDLTPETPSVLALAGPEILIADEAHRLKNESASCTRKIAFFMESHPLLPFVPLSGTMCNDSIQDYSHLLEWSMKAYAPVPRTYVGKRDWSYALDVNVSEKNRLEIGALIELAKPEDMWDWDDTAKAYRPTTPLTAARRGFRRRLIETPGVVTFAEAFSGSSLFIKAIEPPYSAVTEDAFMTLRTQFKMPDDSSVLPDETKPGQLRNPINGMQRWAGGRQMALGFFYTQDPPPPVPWSTARTEWHQAVRRGIGSAPGIDSAGAVAMACSMMLPGKMWAEIRQAYGNWVAIRDTYDPEAHKVTRWLDDGPLEFVATWMSKAHAAIVWTEHRAFAERLADVTGAPFYGEEGVDEKTGQPIEDARPKKGHRAIIASIQSNSEGRNLQEHYYENLYTSCPTTGLGFEQTTGRTHRHGQPADEVSVDILVGCTEQASAFWDARADSHFSTDSMMGVKAKLLVADCDFPEEDEIIARGRHGSARWW